MNYQINITGLSKLQAEALLKGLQEGTVNAIVDNELFGEHLHAMKFEVLPSLNYKRNKGYEYEVKYVNK